MQLLARAAVICLLSFAVRMSAESRVCIGGDLDHMTEAEKSGCWNSAHQVGSAAVKFKGPDNWHYFVVCSEADWKAYTAFSKRGAVELAEMGADTDIGRRTTFFRGPWLRNIGLRNLDRVVAHEVATALMQTTDEKLIQRQIAEWFPAPDEKTLTLAASR
jgi:hypothetical protein